MGINFILPLIAGIVMTVILGSQVAPSLVENMKIAKVENRTIANQNLIKDAITKYIKLEGKAPTSMEDLKIFILIMIIITTSNHNTYFKVIDNIRLHYAMWIKINSKSLKLIKRVLL